MKSPLISQPESKDLETKKNLNKSTLAVRVRKLSLLIISNFRGNYEGSAILFYQRPYIGKVICIKIKLHKSQCMEDINKIRVKRYP